MKEQSDFDPRRAAKRLLREGRSGALATLLPGSGGPYCSLVNVATAADGAPLLLISQLAVHTKNILVDNRISLMLDERKQGDPLEGARVMLMGKAVVTDDPAIRRRYLVRHPDAEMFAGFRDFAFYKIELTGVHLVAGFGRIVDLKPGEVLTDLSDAAALVEAEPDIVAHMNQDHANTCRLYATKLLGAAEGDWRCAGCDPEGMELQLDRTALRLFFSQRIISPGALRESLKDMAEKARA